MNLPTTIDKHIFRAYDVRGLYGTQLTAEVAYAIGKGFGTTLRRMYNIEHPKVVLGRDARTHGPELEDACKQGLLETGCEVYLIGQMPTPVNYFTVCDAHFDGGVHITASHNPSEYNGCKIQVRESHAFAGEDLQTLLKLIESGNFEQGEGSEQTYDAETPYLARLKELFDNCGSGMHIAVDSGNGVAGPLYTKAIEQTGATVSGLYIEPDGTFPNHLADPSKHATLAELQELVQKEQATIGFAFDGDGDRVGIIDETGAIKTADDMLLLLAKDHLERKAGTDVVCTVSSSGSIETEVTKWGGKAHMCKVGHSYVEHAMHDYGALLGGEQSGHFFCSEDYYGFDDALVASLRLLSLLHNSGKTVSELCNEFPTVYQMPEKRPHCDDALKTQTVADITKHFAKNYPVNTLDGARIDFGGGNWAGIRQSNTSPCLSICIEARSPEDLERIQTEVLDHIASYPQVDLDSLH